MKQALKPGLLIVVICLAALVLIEVSLQSFLPNEAFRYSGNDAYWQATHMTTNCELPVSTNMELDDRLGWRMRRNFQSDGITHDENGFRRSIVNAQSANRPIIALGEAFTYGLGMPDELTYSAQLAQLTEKSVINMGVNAYGIDQAILLWENEGRAYNPEVVILGYYFGEFHRNALRISYWVKPSFLVGSNGKLQARELSQCQQLVSELSTWRLGSLIKWLWRKVMDKLGSYPTEMLENRRALSHALLKRLRDSVSATNAKLVVLLIPGCAYPKDSNYGDWVLSRTKLDCRSLGISCIDFADGVRPEMYGDNCHWSEEGHRHAARQIDQLLKTLSPES